MTDTVTSSTPLALRPCPFCGSTSIDLEGWASTDRKGPACDDCGASADTVEIWNARPIEDRLKNFLKVVWKALMDISFSVELRTK